MTRPGAGSDNHLDLVIVVSGSPQAVRINLREPLSHAVREALRLTGNVGQPEADWELRLEDGTLLAQDARGGEANLHDGQTLFLNPRAGAGG